MMHLRGASPGPSADEAVPAMSGDGGAVAGPALPLRLAYCDEEGKFMMDPEAVAALQLVKGPVGIVSVCGRARQGKSFILNQLLGRSSGFQVDSTHRPCTKGLWIWCPPLKRIGIDGIEYTILLLDTEGIDASGQMETYSVRIFSLAFLLSSILIFNQMGEDSTLDRLSSLVMEMTEHVRVKESGGRSTASELGQFSPVFVWLLRDFYLDLTEDNRKIAPRDYLELQVRPVQGGGRDESAKNAIRESIRAVFPNRECFTLVRPVNDEKDLQRLDQLPLSNFRPQYRSGLDAFTKFVLDRTTPKQVGSSTMTGPIFVLLMQSFLDAINSSDVPTISSAWQGALRSLRDEREASLGVQSLQNGLMEDLNRAKLEAKRLNDQIKMLQDTNKGLQEYNTSLQQYNSNLQADATKNAETIAKLQKEKNTMVETMNGLKGHANSVNMQLDITERSDMTALEFLTEYENMKKMLESAQSRLAVAEQTILDGENLRKKLHNTILELKGNIRVFCRVRPLLPNESGAVSYPKSGENLGRGIELLHNAQGYSFTFDKVFDHSASQEHVFIEISQLVQSALDGYKVCIFAYGQTGSGKTYTMMGNPELEDQKGMIPRSLELIFQASQALNSQGWRYKMQASMLEIYNETIRDLLVTDRMAAQDGGPSKYIIKHYANGNTNVSDLTVVDVTSINKVSSLLKQAIRSRSVGRTKMNEESSRSHFVFTLRIFGVNEGTDQQVQGVLNLIDLAGSERLNKSGATGDRLKETLAINKSLSCLGDVIYSIANKDDHVPFRNSKLTYLLQPCLGGDSKTLMFVNLSPQVSSTGESLCSLRFAARVNSCEIGIPQRQTQMQSSH